MKKFLKLMLLVLVALFLVSCGGGNNEQPTENAADKAKEYLNSLEIVYAEGESASAVKSDITLKGVDAEGVTITWTSDNAAIVINGNKGTVKQSEDDVKVKVSAKLTYKDITLTKPFNLVVVGNKPATIAVTGVSVNAEKTEIEVDEELALTVTVAPENATTQTVTWSTSDAFVATVDKSGKVTGIAAGTVTITATSDDNADITGSVTLTVVEPLAVSTISNVLAQLEVVETKIMATVVGKYAQGYMLYDETGYILYYLGKDAELSYQVGDYLEVVGKVEEYNGRYQFTKTAKATKLANNTPYTFDYFTYTAEELPSYLENVEFGQPLEFTVVCTKASGSYAEFSIKGTTYGLTIAYPMDLNAYTVGVEYLVHGFALYAKTYNEVTSVYVMEIDCAPVHTIKFSTGVESLVVEDIVYTDYNTVELPNIYREGYFFMGWKDGETPIEALTENKDYVLTADWIERNFEAVDFELNGGEFVFDNQFVIQNYNTCKGVVKNYDCYTIYKKGSSSVAWASQYYLKFFMKEIEAGTNIYKIVYKAGENVAVTGELLAGTTVDYDYIISSNASNAAGHPYFKDLYNEDNVESNYWYFVVPADCPSVCNIKVIFNLERAKVDPNALKYEGDEVLPDAIKDHYDFLGWFDNAELTGEPITTHVAGIKKYYAKYEASTYSLTLNLNDGACSVALPESFTVLSETFALPTADQMTREGYIFLGWYENNEGTGKKYTEIEKGTGSDLELFAVWESTTAAQKEVTAEDVAVLNAINATKYVFTDAQLSKYTFLGEGLAAKYQTAINSDQVFTSIAGAAASAVEGDVIYVFAGVYTDAVTVSAANVTIIGPNYGVHGHAERADEAELQEGITISGVGVTLDGLKFTNNAAVNFIANKFTIQNCYVSTVSKQLKDNRKGMIYNCTTDVISDTKILNNFIISPSGQSGYQDQNMAFQKVNNITIQGNYIANTATADNGTANTEDWMFYAATGTIKIIDNEFHMQSLATIMRINQYGSNAYDLELRGNKFWGQAEGTSLGGKFQIWNVLAGRTVDFIGNEIHSTNATLIEAKAVKGTFNFVNNKVYGPAFKVTLSSTDASVFTYKNNYFENGVDTADTTGAAASSVEATVVDTEYAAYVKDLNTFATITFDVDGGSAVENITFNKLGNIVLPTPTKDGFDFGGWYNGETLVTEITEKADVTLKAKWLAIYTITFDAAGGNAIDPISFSDYTKVTLPQAVKEGVAFDAWYEGATRVEALTENRNYTLTAQYANSRTVTFDVDGGSPVENIVYVDYTKVELPSTAKNGFFFDGWYEGETKVTALTESKNYSLKAKWLEIFTISFDVDGGSAVENIQFYKLAGITLPSPTKDNVMFEGWYNGETKVTAITELANISLKAKWVVPFTITFVNDGGDAVEAIKFIDYTKVKLPTATKEGFVFLGWKDGEADAAITENKDYTLTASYRAKSTLVVDANNAEAYATIAAAMAAAKEYDTIQLVAGEYAEAVTVTVANLTIVGPNKGVHGHAETRADEAIITEAVTISAKGVTLDGLKMTTNASIGIGANDFTLQNCIVSSKSKKLVTAGRYAYISNSVSSQVSNVNILNNYIAIPATTSGLYQQAISFDSVKNLLVDNNYFDNKNVTASGYPSTEDNIYYTVAGYFKYTNNEFHMYSDFELFRIGVYESLVQVSINNNKFYGNTEGGSMSCRIFNANTIKAGSSIEFIGNEIHSTNVNAIRFNGAKVDSYVAYNKFYDVEYMPLLSSYTKKVYYECNWFEKGVATADTTGAAASAVANAADVDTAYANFAQEATITFDTDGAAAIEAIKFTRIDKVALPTPVKEGFEFVGWFDGENKVTAITKKADATLKAKWLQIYTVTFDAAGGTEVAAISFTDYATVSLPVTAKEGYSFLGWYEGEAKVEALSENKNYSLQAKFKENTSVVKYFDGINEITTLAAPKFEDGELQVPAYEVEGFVFVGWYADDKFTQPLDLTKEITESVNLYALLVKIDYKNGAASWTTNEWGTLNAKNGIAQISTLPQEFEKDFFKYLSENDLLASSKVGATMKITTFEQFCAVNPVHAGDPYKLWNDCTENNLVATADGYVANFLFGSLEYDATAGKLTDIKGGFLGTEPYKTKYFNVMQHLVLLYNGKYASKNIDKLADSNLTRIAYAFLLDGWFYGTQGLTTAEGVFNAARRTVPTPSTGYTWDGSKLVAYTTEYPLTSDKSSVDTMFAPAFGATEFLGWYADEQLKTKLTAENLANRMTIYARFAVICNITFDVDGGSEVTNITTSKLASVVLPTPTKDGFEFGGWYEGETKVEALTEEKDYALKAKWIPIVTLAVDASDLAIINKYNPTILVKTDFTEAGYVIDGKNYASTQCFKALDSALAAAKDGDVIYVFAGTYTMVACTKKLTIVGPNADAKATAERAPEAILETKVITINAPEFTFNGVEITGVGNNDIIYTSKTVTRLSLISCYLYDGNSLYRSKGGTIDKLEVIDCYLAKITQFVVWDQSGKVNQFDMIGCYYDATNGGVGSGRIRVGTNTSDAVLNIYNNYFDLTGTLAGATLFAVRNATNTMNIFANTIKTASLPLVLEVGTSAKGTVNFDSNLFVDAANATIADVSSIAGTATLTVEMKNNCASEADRKAAYDKYVAELEAAKEAALIKEAVAAIAADYLADFNAAASTTCTVNQLDTNYIDSAKITIALSDATMNAKWAWLYTAINTATNNPEMAIGSADVSASAVKGYYFANLYGFLNQESHKDTWLGTQSADWSNIELVKQVVNAKPAN